MSELRRHRVLCRRLRPDRSDHALFPAAQVSSARLWHLRAGGLVPAREGRAETQEEVFTRSGMRMGRLPPNGTRTGKPPKTAAARQPEPVLPLADSGRLSRSVWSAAA